MSESSSHAGLWVLGQDGENALYPFFFFCLKPKCNVIACVHTQDRHAFYIFSFISTNIAITIKSALYVTLQYQISNQVYLTFLCSSQIYFTYFVIIIIGLHSRRRIPLITLFSLLVSSKGKKM